MTRRTISEQADQKAAKVENETIVVSFEFLDLENEHFFVSGLDHSYYKKFFECLETLRNATRKEFSSQTHSSLRVKSIFNTSGSLYPAFPEKLVDRVKNRIFVESRDEEFAKAQARKVVSCAFEVSVGKNQGRLHGFLWDSAFHLVWIDPAHNLYCKGEPTGLRLAAAVKGFTPEITRELRDKLRQAQDDIDLLLAQ